MIATKPSPAKMQALSAKLSELAQAYNRDIDAMAGPHSDAMRSVAAASQVWHAIQGAANPEAALNTIMHVLIEACQVRGLTIKMTEAAPSSREMH